MPSDDWIEHHFYDHDDRPDDWNEPDDDYLYDPCSWDAVCARAEDQYEESGDETIPFELAENLIEKFRVPTERWPSWLLEWCVDRATESNPANLGHRLAKKRAIRRALNHAHFGKLGISVNKISPNERRVRSRGSSLEAIARAEGVSLSTLKRWRREWVIWDFKLTRRDPFKT